jgi:FtsP/CotA-like multicopper oxidase with cupredoxin domain
MSEEENSAPKVNRRRFAGSVAVLGVAAAGAAALAPDGVRIVREPAASAANVEDNHDHETPAAAAQSSNDLTYEEMDAMHEEGVLAFPQATEGKGGQPLEFTMEDGVKVFNVTCESLQWEFQAGKYADVFAYNGVVPGPEIRVTEGDTIRVNVTNNLPESTAIHWHGLMVPHAMDGVPFITQPPIKPGTTFTYEFPIREGNAGTHMYHSHYNATEQVGKGLLGAFIVEPKDPSTRPAFDVEYTMVLNDGPIGGFSINGKSFPATEPIVVKKGQKLMMRFINEGQMIHPMHLHGMPMKVVAEDGYVLDVPRMRDTVLVDPGARYEAIVDATELGVWAFHCHVLSHAESRHGMFGMVTVLIVEE